MTLLSYQVFKAVVEQGSFQNAANILGITPSAVSHAIANMEEELGTSLFIRNRNGNILTNFGKEILPYVNAILNSEESLKQAVSELNGPQSGKVKIGTFSSACNNWIPKILETFEKKYPAVSVDVYEGSYMDIAEWLKNGIIDFGFISRSAVNDLPFEPLYKDPLVCITPKSFHKESSGENISFDDLRQLQFIMLQENVDADIRDYLKDNQVTYSSSYHIRDDLSALVMVESGFGFTVLPEMVLKGLPFNIDTYQFEKPGYRIIGLSAISHTSLSPAAKAMYNYIVQMYKND